MAQSLPSSLINDTKIVFSPKSSGNSPQIIISNPWYLEIE